MRREHRWQDGRCIRCEMRSTWEGARYECSGVIVPVAPARPICSACKRCGVAGHSRITCPQRPPRKSDAEYARAYRARKAARMAVQS